MGNRFWAGSVRRRLVRAVAIAGVAGTAAGPAAAQEQVSRHVFSSGAVDTAEPAGVRLRATVGQVLGRQTESVGGAPVGYATLGFWARRTLAPTDAPGFHPELALDTVLLPNVPNPFGARTDVRFTLAREGRVEIPVFDVSGRRVATVADGWYVAGRHTVRFAPRDLPAGVYFYRLQAGDAVETRRFLLLK